MSDTKSINVGTAFRRQDLPSSALLQALDYTAYPQGAKKIGLVCQDGLAKRKVVAEVYKDRILLSPIMKDGGSPVAVNSAKPLPNVGILSAVDKFFSWVNGVLK